MRWRAKRLLRSDNDWGDTRWYYYSTIEQVHRTGRCADVEIPSVEELLQYQAATNAPVLLTIAEVESRLGMKPSTFSWEIQSGAVGAFRLPGRGGSGTWRIPVQCLAAYIAALKPDAVTIAVAGKIIGLSEIPMRDLLSQGDTELKRIHVRRQRNTWFVTTPSIVSYLTRYLARNPEGEPHMTAQEWMAMRELYNFEELLTPQEIIKVYQTHWRVVKRNIANGTFPCLWTPGGHARIPRHAVEAWNMPRLPVPYETLAQVFGLSHAEALVWHTLPAMFCVRRHSFTNKECPTLACLEKYIQVNRFTEDLNPTDWIADCTQGGLKIVQQPIPDSSKGAELLAKLEEGVIRGILLPGNTKVVIPEVDWLASLERPGQ